MIFPMVMGTQSSIDLLSWDLAAGAIVMNEAMPETNSRPATSSADEDAVARESLQVVTKEEVTAAAAVAALAAQAASIASGNESDTSNKRERTETDEASATPSTSLNGEAPTTEIDRAESVWQKIARLDGHIAVPSNKRSPIANVKPMVTPPIQDPSLAAGDEAAAPSFQDDSLATRNREGDALPTTQEAPVKEVPAPPPPAAAHLQLQLLGPKPPPAATPTAASVQGKPAEVPLRPFPYFYYKDWSRMPDPDPLTPLTAPGRVPNFPAKMHAILSRQDLAEVVAWMPHGRAWRVLKPREFETKVIPQYFEHSKFSSFIRQSNGWGFRRITQGKDRNAYYHEMFLRGLPHLCKMMKRPGVSEKQASDPDQEPDFYKISEENPVPERAEDDSILLRCTLQGGPKARMPIYFGTVPPPSSTLPGGSMMSSAPTATGSGVATLAAPHSTCPTHGQQYFHHAPPAQHPTSNHVPHYEPHASHAHIPHLPDLKIPTSVSYSHSINSSGGNTPPQVGPNGIPVHSLTPLPLHQDYTSTVPDPTKGPAIPAPIAGMLSASSSDPASQFAAGFAAAASLSPDQLKKILSQALAAPPQTLATQSNSTGSPPPTQQRQTHALALSTNEQLYLPSAAAPTTGHRASGQTTGWKDHGPPPPTQYAPHPQQGHHNHQYQQPPHYQHPPSPPHQTQYHQQHHPPAPEYHHPHHHHTSHSQQQHHQPQYQHHQYQSGSSSPHGPPHHQQGGTQYHVVHMAPQPAPAQQSYEVAEGHHPHHSHHHHSHQQQHSVDYHQHHQHSHDM